MSLGKSASWLRLGGLQFNEVMHPQTMTLGDIVRQALRHYFNVLKYTLLDLIVLLKKHISGYCLQNDLFLIKELTLISSGLIQHVFLHDLVNIT